MMYTNDTDVDMFNRLRKWQRCTHGMIKFWKNKYILPHVQSEDLKDDVQFRHGSIDSSIQRFSSPRRSINQKVNEMISSPSPKLRRAANKFQTTPHLQTLGSICKMESRKHEYMQECVLLGRELAKWKSASKRRNKGSPPSSPNMDDVFQFEMEEETLTPFEAVADFKRLSPAYWIGCSYGFQENSGQLDMTIRQTGELTNRKYTDMSSQLVLKVSCIIKPLRKRREQTVILKPSGHDMHYKSSKLSFNIPEVNSVSECRLRFSLFLATWYSKKKIHQWEIPVDTCTNKISTEWNRVSFTPE